MKIKQRNKVDYDKYIFNVQALVVRAEETYSGNKLASLEATLVETTYHPLTDSLTGVKCRATSVAKNSCVPDTTCAPRNLCKQTRLTIARCGHPQMLRRCFSVGRWHFFMHPISSMGSLCSPTGFTMNSC